MTWQRVASVTEVPAGTNKAFTIGDRQVLVAHAPMGIYAVGAICSHQQQDLEGGKMKACFIFCPLHGVRFDLRDGKPAGTLTDVPLPTWRIRVEGDEIQIDMDS